MAPWNGSFREGLSSVEEAVMVFRVVGPSLFFFYCCRRWDFWDSAPTTTIFRSFNFFSKHCAFMDPQQRIFISVFNWVVTNDPELVALTYNLLYLRSKRNPRHMNFGAKHHLSAAATIPSMHLLFLPPLAHPSCLISLAKGGTPPF